MAFQVSPGVLTTEKDLTTIVPNVSTTVGGMVGPFQWGPVLERVQVATENEMKDRFGEPNDDIFEDWLSASAFLAYSNNLHIVRTIGANAKNAVVGGAAAGTAVLVKTEDHHGSITFTDQLVIAKYPGTLGNSLKVEMCDSNDFSGWANKAHFDAAPGTSSYVTARGGSNDELHILIIDEDGLWTGTPGEVLEKWAFVSRARDAKTDQGGSNYWIDVLNNQSKYVWAGINGELGGGAGGDSTGTYGNVVGIRGGSLAGGVDDNTSTGGGSNANRQTGWAEFQNAEEIDVSILFTGGGTTTVGAWVKSNVAETRKDCVVCVSPNRASVVNNSGSEVTDLGTDKTTIGSSSYAIMDSAWKYTLDRYNDKFRWVPMNGDIAGLMARTDITDDPWFSPAGYNRGGIKNAIKLSWSQSKANRDSIYQTGVNPIVNFPSQGITLFGDKTCLTKPSAFDRINVRRLFIVLEKAIARAAKFSLFELNDEFTRSQFKALVEPFLRTVQGRRGVTDFKVVCDDSNNTGDIIDRNEFIADIYVKPARSINYIQLNFIATRTDVSFEEVGG
tara:strand:- start:6580 stop:8256 length:1677 start_codon:yes stop_codon:yes gene_type:complete